MTVMAKDVFDTTEQAAILNVKDNLKYTIDKLDIFNRTLNTFTQTQYSKVSTEENCVFAGGYFVSSFLGQPINDIDMFILNGDAAQFEYLVTHPNEKRGKNNALPATIFNETKWQNERWLFNNNLKNGNYLNNDSVIWTAFDNATRMQYILTSHKTRQELIADFDMIHCTVSYVHGYEQKLYITRKSYESIIHKMILPHNWKSYKKSKADRKPRFEKLYKNGWKLDLDAINAVAKKNGEAIDWSLNGIQMNIVNPNPYNANPGVTGSRIFKSLKDIFDEIEQMVDTPETNN